MNYSFMNDKFDLDPIFKGKRYLLEFQITDNDDVPVDITSFTISANCRSSEEYVGDLIFDFEVDKTSPTFGIFTLGLAASISASISQTYGYYTLEVDDGIDPDVEVYLWGQINFKGTL